MYIKTLCTNKVTPWVSEWSWIWGEGVLFNSLQAFIPFYFTERFIGNCGWGPALHLGKLRRKMYYTVVLITLFIVFFLFRAYILDKWVNVLAFFKVICSSFCLPWLFCCCYEFLFLKKYHFPGWLNTHEL